MDDDVDMEESLAPEAMTEVDILKDQLTTYQMLNNDLSKKVQEFKIHANTANKELVS
jgi:hypothetical protein